jgi:hypothetical protein
MRKLLLFATLALPLAGCVVDPNAGYYDPAVVGVAPAPVVVGPEVGVVGGCCYGGWGHGGWGHGGHGWGHGGHVGGHGGFHHH